MEKKYWLYFRSGSEWQYLDEYDSAAEAEAVIPRGVGRYYKIQEVYHSVKDKDTNAN